MRTHGGRIYDEGSPEQWLDFSANINPYGPPGFALRATREALGRLRRYPDEEGRTFRNTVARWTGHLPEGVAWGNGASDLLLPLYLALNPARVVIPAPTFAEYAVLATGARIPVAQVPLRSEEGFRLSGERFAAALRPGDLAVLCQPNNPTGGLWSADDLTRIAETCRALGAWMLVDECFFFLTWPASPSLARTPWPERLLVLRAFTKDFAAPGLRIGYLLGPPDVVARVRRCQQPWPVSTPAEAFALACLDRGAPFLARSRRLLARHRQSLAAGLSALGFSVFPCSANFLFLRSPLSGSLIQKYLLGHHILVRRCHSFDGLDDSYLRVAVRRPRDTGRLLGALGALLEAPGRVSHRFSPILPTESAPTLPRTIRRNPS